MIMEHLQIELPEKYKNVIKDATIEIVDGNIIITPKKQEFKDGDICYCKNDYGDFIFIFNRFDDKFIKETYYYFGLFDDLSELYNSKFKDIWDIRIATEEEKQKLFDALKSKGKNWNPETKQIEDILKVGDICIFWDDDKSKAAIAIYSELNIGSFPPGGFNAISNIEESGEYLCFKNAIKCISLEQYINFIK